MIVISVGIPQSVAEAASRSLDTQIEQLRAEGRLKPGKSTQQRLNWTDETITAGVKFKENVDLTPVRSLGLNAKREDFEWKMPIVYSEVSSDPLKYAASGLKNGFIGILALGPVVLPEYGDSGRNEMESGLVAYFRESDRVVYRECEGRGLMLYFSSSSGI